MNEYFSSIGHNLASKMPNPQKEFFDYLPKSRNAASFFFNPVTQTEIESEIMNTPLRAAVRKYRLRVCKMKKSKIPKLCQNIGLGKLFLEK